MTSNQNKIRCVPYDASFYMSGIIVILILIQHIFNFVNIWLQIIIAISVPFLFTYASGLFLMRIFRIRRFEEKGIFFKIISLSLIGLAFTESFFLVSGFFKLFNFQVLIGFILSLITIYAVRNTGLKSVGTELRSKSSYVWITIASGFSLAIAIWVRPLDSFPNMVGWDLFTHLLTVNDIILQGGITELNLTYLPTVHYFFAAASILGNIDPYQLFWGSIYFLLPLTGASLYFMGVKLSGNNLTGLATAFFGITMGASNETLGAIFPYPSTMGLIMMILATTVLLITRDKKFLLIYLISGALIYEFSLLAILLIIMSLLFLTQTKRKFYAGLLPSTIIFIGGIYVAGVYVLKLGGFSLSRSSLWKILSAAYFNEMGLVLLAFGIYFMITYKFFDRKISVLLINGMVILLVIFLIPASFRLEEFLRPIAAFVMGYGIGQLCTHIPKLVKDMKNLSKDQYLSD